MKKNKYYKRLTDKVRFSCSQSTERDTRQNSTRQIADATKNRRDKNYLNIMNDEYFKEIGFVAIPSSMNNEDIDKTTTKNVSKKAGSTPGGRSGTAHQTGKKKTSRLFVSLVSLFLLVSCTGCGTQKLSNTGENYETYEEDKIIYHKT